MERIGDRAAHPCSSRPDSSSSRSRNRGAIHPVPGSVAPFSSMSLSALPRICSILVVLTVTVAARQDLPPTLALRFTEGVTALKSGDLKTAERAFRDVVAKGGERPFVHHNLGIVLQQRGEHEAALAEFRAAERLDPSFGPAWLLAGVSLLAVGRPRDAVTELDRAAELLPGEAAVHLQLADAFERTGNITGVVREVPPPSRTWPFERGLPVPIGKGGLETGSAILRATSGRCAAIGPSPPARTPGTSTSNRTGRRWRSKPSGRRPASIPP